MSERVRLEFVLFLSETFLTCQNANCLTVEVVSVWLSSPPHRAAPDCREPAQSHKHHCQAQLDGGAESDSVDFCGRGRGGVHLGFDSLVYHIQATDQTQQHLR